MKKKITVSGLFVSAFFLSVSGSPVEKNQSYSINVTLGETAQAAIAECYAEDYLALLSWGYSQWSAALIAAADCATGQTPLPPAK